MTTAVWKSKPVAASVVLLLVIDMVGIFAPAVAPHNPNRENPPARLLPPAQLGGGDIQHLLGTDRVGRDVLSRLIYGARISLVVSLIPALVAGAIGATLGMLTGYFGRRTDARGIRLAGFPK